MKNAALYVVVLMALAVVAFWPRYLGQPFGSIGAYMHLHAAFGTLWMLMLIAQPTAIRYNRRDIHRVLGRVSYALAPLFIVTALLLANYQFAAMTPETFAREGYSLYLPIHTTVLFAVCFGLGVYFRRQTPAHSRFMIATALPFIDPVVVRIIAFYLPPLPNDWMYQGITFTMTDIFALALALTYRGPAAARRALWFVFALFVIAHALWFTFVNGAMWFAFATWFRELPLT